jgi:hypothetical protein
VEELPRTDHPWILGADEGVEHFTAHAEPIWSLTNGVDGEPFSEIQGVAITPDGGIVVGDHREARVHFFTAAGAPIRSVGRLGAGPGELRSLDALGLVADGRPWGYDASRRRLVVYGPDDSLTITQAMPRLGLDAWPMIVGSVADDGLVVVEKYFPRPAGSAAGRVWRDSTRLLVLSLIDWGLTPIAATARVDIMVHSETGRMSTMGVPFGPFLSVASDPGRKSVFWGFSDRLQVLRWRPEHGTDTVLNFAVEHRLIEPGAVEFQVSRNPAMARILAGSEPTHMPAFERLLVDTDGWLWVKEYEPAEGVASRWAGFDTTGALRRLVHLPARFTLKAANATNVVGVFEDRSGEESVRLYRLEGRAPSASPKPQD